MAASVRRMSEQLHETPGRLVERQTELWQASINAAQEHWTRSGQAAGKQLQEALATTLDHSLQKHAESLIRADGTIRFAHLEKLKEAT